MPDPKKSEGLKTASEIAKQVITLSTGAVAFTVTFLEKFVPHADGKTLSVPASLYISWGLFALAMGFALWTLMAITGTLIAFDREVNGWTLTDADKKAVGGGAGNVNLPAWLMLVSFFLAVLAMIWTGASVR
jgi:hypothetical protein